MVNCDHCQLSGNIKEIEDNDEISGLCMSCRELFDNHSIQISPLSREDLELVLAWRSNPRIYRYFRQQDRPLNWEEHVAWFESRDHRRHDFIIHFQGRRVGVVNLSENNKVGIFLGDFSARGQGVATATLNWLCDRFNERVPMTAEIHNENTKSQKLFERCGFERKHSDNAWLQYTYDH